MAFDLTEKRYIRETGLEQRIAHIVEPVANDLGYALVRVKVTQDNGCTLQIMAEDENGRFTIDDCERLSKDLSPILDVEDPIDREYHLEVSSPGIDRPMVRKSDFTRWLGHLLKCETSILVDGRKRFRGKIVAADENGFTLERDQPAPGDEPVVVIPFTALAEGRLILTDELIRDALAADKKAKAAQAANQNDEEDGDDEE